MFYHASPVGGIEILEPRVSNHNEPLLYFSDKRENALVYLSNAIEKFCRETGFAHTGKWHKWASYGFDENGIMQLDEYYPHALEDTYKGVSGYIYSADSLGEAKDVQIPNAFATQCKVPVAGVEYIEDAYAEILKAEKKGLIKVRRYDELGDNMHAWIEQTIRNEYEKAENEPDYRYFLKAKFDFLNDSEKKYYASVLQLVQSGVGSAYPCAAVAIGQGHTVFARAFYGQRQVQPTVLELTQDTLFDLASLSKLVSTAMVALKMIENGKLNLHDKIGKYLDFAGNFADCEIYHLLTHTSGLPAGIPLYNEEYKNRDVLQTILSSEKCYETGTQVCYSCMGYLVLQRILENVGGEQLDKLAEKYVFSPLGMKAACYNPDISKTPLAATELYAHSGEWATGHVHDENAHFLGGVAGNAGVFATLDDLISFAGMCATHGIAENGEIYLSKELYDLAITNFTPDKTESRGLGFQLKGQQDFPGGALLSQGSFGHTGFTGTSLYVDKDSGLWGILLTNAVHYGRENRGEYFKFRRQFYDAMIAEYKKSKDGTQ